VSSDIKHDILDSVQDIDDLLSSYNILLSSVKEHDPDNIEIAALGTILHSFYNGIEGIFLLVAKRIDKRMLDSSAWHQQLLEQMTRSVSARFMFISNDTADKLSVYLKFRHFFRHAYAFMLKWQQMKPLVDNLSSVWEATKAEIVEFATNM
jgi:hypothetical protein